jgi:hypothetical protein
MSKDGQPGEKLFLHSEYIYLHPAKGEHKS